MVYVLHGDSIFGLNSAQRPPAAFRTILLTQRMASTHSVLLGRVAAFLHFK